MSVVLFVLALIAAFIGTIVAFRAAKRIHDGDNYEYEAVACAFCVTFVLFAAMQV